MDNHKPVRFDQYDLIKNMNGNKKLHIPDGCERVAIQLTTPNHYCHNTTHLVGSMEISFRHLKKLGYRLVIVNIDSLVYLFLIVVFFVLFSSFPFTNYQLSIHLLLDIVI